jgi:hypothetical protein
VGPYGTPHPPFSAAKPQHADGRAATTHDPQTRPKPEPGWLQNTDPEVAQFSSSRRPLAAARAVAARTASS